MRAATAVYALSLAYFLLAEELPALGTLEATAIASGAVAMIALSACALALLPARTFAFALALMAAGGAMIAAAMTVAGAEASANPAKALFAAGLGLLLAWWLDHPLLVAAIPLFVAGVDIVSVLAGPSEVLLEQRPRAVDFLTFVLPWWGGGAGSQLGLSDILFLAYFAAAACAHGLRRRATALALTAGLVAALVVGVLADRALPVLPFLSFAFLAVNLDRLGAMVRSERAASG